MDDSTLTDASQTPSEVSDGKATLAGKQGRKREPQWKRPPIQGVTDWRPDYAPLVDQDGLFVCVPAVSNNPKAPCGPATQLGADGRKLVKAFRQCFCGLWHRIPELDRQLLLAYWRGLLEPLLRSDFSVKPHPWPLIRLVEGHLLSPSFRCLSNFGHQLDFPVSLVVEPPQHLYEKLTDALTRAFMFASRRHWKLVIDLMEDSFARWERWQGARITDAASNKKWDLLEAKFLRVYDAELGQILHRWGCKRM